MWIFYGNLALANFCAKFTPTITQPSETSLKAGFRQLTNNSL